LFNLDLDNHILLLIVIDIVVVALYEKYE